LVFYTDGVTETAGAAGQQLGIDGLAEIASAAIRLDLFSMADHILEQIAQYQQGQTTDDKTLIVAEIR
jgi:serine phosphatase RsbU (regulator of sigma subunit)